MENCLEVKLQRAWVTNSNSLAAPRREGEMSMNEVSHARSLAFAESSVGRSSTHASINMASCRALNHTGQTLLASPPSDGNPSYTKASAVTLSTADASAIYVSHLAANLVNAKNFDVPEWDTLASYLAFLAPTPGPVSIARERVVRSASEDTEDDTSLLVLEYITMDYPEQYTYYGYANLSQTISVVLRRLASDRFLLMFYSDAGICRVRAVIKLNVG
ncbi:hypothetical protein EDD22DRAFT_1019118 [Suillus occidentalis]|nr:hypothetical protein EDD22DRAFT_1019118 [Suillus occidentalis]